MSKLFHVKHREAMEGSGRLGGYEQVGKSLFKRKKLEKIWLNRKFVRFT